ncbi:hypothetical protein GF325_11885 [Candidatus Bathyarchaeota archaeon]|nr:hypothetical protein [Candidatus Bathyarchaeota archaeon]
MEENEAPSSPNKKKNDERKKQKKKRLRGFAGTIHGLMAPLNEYKRFQQSFKDTRITFLVVATDYPPAALITIDHGKVKVEAVRLKHVKETNRDALLQGTLQRIMDIAMGKLNPVKAWLTRKIKLRKPKKLLLLNKAFYYMKKQQKEKKEQARDKIPKL